MKFQRKTLVSILLMVCIISLLAVPASAKSRKKTKVKPILNITSATIGVGQTLPLTVTNGVKVKWSSSKKKIAKVKGGRVTAKKVGKVTITAKAKGKKAKCKITVVAEAQDLDKYLNPNPKPIIEVAGIELNPTGVTIKEGETKTIQAKCIPENATDKTIAWSSSDPSVVSVDGGIIKGVKAGKASITATAKNGTTASCSVVVDWADGTELSVVSNTVSFPKTIDGVGTITSVKVRKYRTKINTARYEIEICGKVTSDVLEKKAGIEILMKYLRSDGSAATDIRYGYLVTANWISSYGKVDNNGNFKLTYPQDENSILVDYDKVVITSIENARGSLFLR